jgi:hypothetical protein
MAGSLPAVEHVKNSRIRYNSIHTTAILYGRKEHQSATENISDHIIWNISCECSYICVEVKVKVTPKVITGKERSTTPILDPGHSTPRKELRYPFTRGWVGFEACVVGYNESLSPTGIRKPDRPSDNQSLYRISYPGL